MLWSNERIGEFAQAGTFRYSDVAWMLRFMRDEYEARINELEGKIAEWTRYLDAKSAIIFDQDLRIAKLEAENKSMLIELSNCRNALMVKEFLAERSKRKVKGEYE